ncbi:hypothetical protein J7T55_007462 [Diaporthe amygdali]|uniref:uncharacterized protein n=1 Tax=Phomopsis amygdali TaxID=1214568 RepID=UPI0022FEFCF2|nr:uncharacterized protein J7T55_007462 [Diaporthe amygdali]KAJ0116482.1 hypothetical protein J7T55_007462 [Diaporthe amygdali]
MVNTSSSLAPALSSFEANSSDSHDQGPPPKRVCREAPRKRYPPIAWLTQRWLAKSVPYERIATASPRLGVGVIGQGLLNHHINLSPGITGIADFAPVRDIAGHHLGYRVKIATWPLSKQDALKAKELAA